MKNLEKSTSEAFREIWGQLSKNQKRFVLIAANYKTKAEAARAIDLQPSTVYGWPSIVDEAIGLLQTDIAGAAVGVLATEVARAAMVKVDALDSVDERIRQDAASEILDRVLGKPTQRQELSGPEGGLVPVKILCGVSLDDL